MAVSIPTFFSSTAREYQVNNRSFCSMQIHGDQAYDVTVYWYTSGLVYKQSKEIVIKFTRNLDSQMAQFVFVCDSTYARFIL